MIARPAQAALLALAFMPSAAPAHDLSLPEGASHRHSQTRIITEYADGRVVYEVVAGGGPSEDGRPLPVGLIYTRHPDGTQEWVMPDGRRVLRTADGQLRQDPPPEQPQPDAPATAQPPQLTMTIKHYADGRIQEQHSDHSVEIHPDGLRITRHRDGRISREYTMPGSLFSNGGPIPPGFTQTEHPDGRVETIYKNGGQLDGRRVSPGFMLVSWPNGCQETLSPGSGRRAGNHTWHPPDCKERMADHRRPATPKTPAITGNPQMPSTAADQQPQPQPQPDAAQRSARQTVLGRELGHIVSLFSGVRMPGGPARTRTLTSDLPPPSQDYLEFERYGDLLIGYPRPGASLPDGQPIPEGYLLVRYADGCEKISLPQGAVLYGKSHKPGTTIWNSRPCLRKHGE